MALPKFNDVPKYDVEIPSTKQKIRYRPFLVKEQKILLMALETKDQKSILAAITDTLESCIEDNIMIRQLTSFDVEYLFTQIRSKSVGEKTTIGFYCTECEEQTDVEIDLSTINIDVPDINKTIELNEQYKLDMKYPTYFGLLEDEINSESNIEQIYRMLILCLDKLKTDDEIIDFADESKEDIMNFIEQLTTGQFDKIMDFVNKIPALQHDVEFECTGCGHKNTSTLQGISDFF